MQPIKSFMKNSNLVSDSSVGDKKKLIHFIHSKVGQFIFEKKRNPRL